MYQECEVDDDGTVPLLEWPTALQCRRRKTVDKPLSFKLNINIDYESTLETFDDWFNQFGVY